MDNPSNTLIREQLAASSARSAPEALAHDDTFWTRVAAEFAKPADFVHLEYGFYHPVCRAVFEAEVAAMRQSQICAAHYKRNEMRADYEAARAELAQLVGAAPEEVAITRNASESMNIIIRGIPLAPGDEVVGAELDYGSMVEAWEQRVRQEGIALRAVELPFDPRSDDEIVQCFAAAITPRTRVLYITHLVHFTGHLLPVRRLCQLGRERGLLVVVDAAHSFAQVPFTPAEIDCDFLGASLHKWLAAPLGLGMLYVRRDRIAGLHPLFGDARLPAGDIRRLEHFGNRPDSAHIGLREAIRWHGAMGGAAVKRARLLALQRRWMEAARALPRLRLLTPRDPARHGSLGTFAVDGLAPAAVAERLMREHRIYVNVIQGPRVAGVRVTPGLATTFAEIDQLVAALEALNRTP
ncbi:MAG: aminotransferase class V-fold PLP-dependent enzyme [Opitutae bacterium]|nr:aminotransferase class V-fold PLP-dependent enzyme [Opitutae bacterium]